MNTAQKIAAQLYPGRLPSYIKADEFIAEMVDRITDWLESAETEWVEFTDAPGIICPIRADCVDGWDATSNEVMFDRMTGLRRRGMKESDSDYERDCAYWSGRWDAEIRRTPNPDLRLVRCSGCSDLRVEQMRIRVRALGWPTGERLKDPFTK